MNLAICSLASSSSGNCYVVKTQSTAILVDAGISYKQIKQGLDNLGIDPGELACVLVTHEHADHIKGLPVLEKKTGVKLIASKGTAEQLGTETCVIESYIQGASFRIGDIDVSSFSVSHDAADPVGYSFRSGGRCISLVTDTGILTEEIKNFMKCADILVLESNHDENVLRMGRYPWFLKQRILGDYGHLSNEAAAEGLAELLAEEKESGALKPRRVLLAHLSKENNFPEMALATMENILQEHGIAAGKEIKIEALARTEMSLLYES